MSVILCGLPGSGKSTFGELAAGRLGLPFIDTDRLIEELDGRGCREIFLNEGELYFRSLEQQVVKSLKSRPPSIIATGGGALADSSNVALLKSLGKLIYLRASWQGLYPHVIERGIPAYLDPVDPLAAFRELAEQRQPIYEKAADYQVLVEDITKQQVLDRLLEILRGVYGKQCVR